MTCNQLVLRLITFWVNEYDFHSLQGVLVNYSSSSAAQVLRCAVLQIPVFVRSEFLVALAEGSEQC